MVRVAGGPAPLTRIRSRPRLRSGSWC